MIRSTWNRLYSYSSHQHLISYQHTYLLLSSSPFTHRRLFSTSSSSTHLLSLSYPELVAHTSKFLHDWYALEPQEDTTNSNTSVYSHTSNDSSIMSSNINHQQTINDLINALLNHQINHNQTHTNIREQLVTSLQELAEEQGINLQQTTIINSITQTHSVDSSSNVDEQVDDEETLDSLDTEEEDEVLEYRRVSSPHPISALEHLTTADSSIADSSTTPSKLPSSYSLDQLLLDSLPSVEEERSIQQGRKATEGSTGFKSNTHNKHTDTQVV